MKKSKFSEAQIVYAIRENESGTKVAEITRRLGISQATFFTWKKKYGDMGVTELKRLRALEDENAQLKKLVADLSLDKQMLQDIKKKVLALAIRKAMAHYLQEAYAVSLRRSLCISNVSSCMWYYKKRDRGDQWLRMRMKEIAAVRVRYGFERILIMLRREGFKDNHKRVYRVYREEGLNLRSKRPRRSRSGAHRLERVDTPAINRVWSMDFLQDALFNGQRFRILAIVDNYSKKCLSLLVGKSLRGEDVRNELSQVCKEESCFPERIQCDNGSEFISKEVDRWAYENNVTLDFSRPGTPTDNPYVESFNGKFRDECLSMNWFMDLDDAREKIEEFRVDYNTVRPHSSIYDLPPEEFIYLHQTNPEFSS